MATRNRPEPTGNDGHRYLAFSEARDSAGCFGVVVSVGKILAGNFGESPFIIETMKLKNRLPPFEAILPVYAVIAFMVFSWTIVSFLWKLPSWIQFLNLGDILVVFAYSMTSALLESLAILGILLLACLLLPARWMRDVFVTRGTTAAVFGFGSIMLYMYRYSEIGYSFISSLFLWSLAGLAVAILMTFLSTHIRGMVRAAAWVSDRLIVFLFLFVPISLVSLLVVIYRNIF